MDTIGLAINSVAVLLNAVAYYQTRKTVNLVFLVICSTIVIYTLLETK